MQLYLIAPFIMYFIYRYNKKTIFVLVLSILGCVGHTVFIHLKHQFRYIMYVYCLYKFKSIHARYFNGELRTSGRENNSMDTEIGCLANFLVIWRLLEQNSYSYFWKIFVTFRRIIKKTIHFDR